MLCRWQNSCLRVITSQSLRSVSYANQGYWPQTPSISDPSYQTEIQRRLEARLKAREENVKASKFFGKIEVLPEFPEVFPPTDLSKMSAKPLPKLVPVKKVRTGVIAKKLGMMGLYDEHGVRHAVTVLQVDNLEVLRYKMKTRSKRGLCGLVLGYGSKKIRQVPKDQLGENNKYKICPKRRYVEFQVAREGLLPSGTQIDVRHFLPGQKVDIQGHTIFRRWCGVIKRWGFAGGPATHGSTKFHRRPGSIGACADPGKVWKGKKMPGPMGGKLHWHRHQPIMRIDPRHGLIFIRGVVPGARSSYVKVCDSMYRAPAHAPFPTFFPDPNETDPGPPIYMETRNKKIQEIGSISPDEKDWVDRYSKDLPL